MSTFSPLPGPYSLSVLDQAIRDAIRQGFDRIVAEEIQMAKEEFDRRAPEVIAAAILNIGSYLKADHLGHEIVFHIRLEDLRKPR